MTVNVKVIEVKEVFQLHDKVKQDVVVADLTGVARVCLWEEHVNFIEEHKSYCLIPERGHRHFCDWSSGSANRQQ